MAIKAPPKASIANKTLIIVIVLKFFGLIPTKLRLTFYSLFLASIAFELSIIQYANTFNNPKSEYM